MSVGRREGHVWPRKGVEGVDAVGIVDKAAIGGSNDLVADT